MAKYLDYEGLVKVWDKIKGSFAAVKSDTTLSDGQIATFHVVTDPETNKRYVDLIGINNSFASSSHTHGNITNAGKITASGSTASGDTLVVTDSNGVIKKSGIVIGSANTFLKNDGSWATPTNSASLQISSTDKSNTRFSTSETSGKYIKFTGGTNKFSVTDATGGTDHTFEVAITPNINANVIKTGAITANKIPVWNATVASGDTSGVLKDGYSVDSSLSSSATAIPTSAAVSSAISGLSGAMHFVGISTSTMTDGQTTNPTVSGVSSFSAGDVVVDATETEFVLGKESTPKWHKLGDANSYALNSIQITGTGALSGGGDLTTNRTITHNTSALGITTDTNYGPSQDVTGSNNTTLTVPQLTVDKYGHIVGVTNRTYTSVDHTYTSLKNPNAIRLGNSSTYIDYDGSAANYQLILTGSGVSLSKSNNVITATITNTVYTLPKATTSALGGIIASNALTSAVTLTSGNGSTANRYYGVQVDKDGKAFVNVPWTDQATTQSGHYTPSTVADYTATAGSWTWGTTKAVVGLTKDDKGHVIGVTTTTIANPNVTTSAFVAAANNATAATAAATTISNGSLYYIIREGSSNTATLITGSGGTTVTKDANGTNRIIITSPEVLTISESEIDSTCVL